MAFAGAISRKKKPDPLPDLPDEAAYLWVHYQRLSRRRSAGMGANPISFLELEAYERKSLIDFTAFETDLLMRVDDAVLGAWAGERPASGKPESSSIPSDDAQGVRSLFRGIATQKRAERDIKAKRTKP